MSKIKYLLVTLLSMLHMSFGFAKDNTQGRAAKYKVSKTTKHKSTKQKVAAQKLTKRVMTEQEIASIKSAAKNSKQANNGDTPKKQSYMQGVASYYGGENDIFDGKKMANGEVFDSNDPLSAAHPTLALGTKLRVTNVKNGRTIYVVVKDRMPKQKHTRDGRVIDLSVAAARYLGMYKRGLTHVNLVKVSSNEFEQNRDFVLLKSGDAGHQG